MTTLTHLDLVVALQAELFELLGVEGEQVGAGDVLVHEGSDVLLQTERQQPLPHLSSSAVDRGHIGVMLRSEVREVRDTGQFKVI